MDEHRLMKYFAYEHLPKNLQAISKPFCELADYIYNLDLNDEAERTASLRKILEAKDCAVRAAL